ncbi:MAG: hypothetical protein ACSHYA_12450 [Opitutaceae bacterium]
MIKIKTFASIPLVVAQLCSAQHSHEAGALHNHKLHHNPYEEHPDFPIELGLITAWESHYISEGRDSLDGNGLVSIEANGTYKGVSLGAWAAESPDVDYTEYNYWLEYTHEWEAFTFTVSYTYLDFPSDDANDQEYGFAVVYALPKGFEFSLSGYFSDESAATFFEATLSTSLKLYNQITATPFVIVGYNDGLVTDGHEGFNHIAVGVELSYELSEQISVGAYLSSSFEIDRDEDRYTDDDALRDFVYGGLSLNFAY